MSVFFKIRHIGDSRLAWQCLSVVAALIAFGYYFLLAATSGVRDGLNGAWVGLGMIASIMLCMVCLKTAQVTAPKLTPPIADGALARPDAEWGYLSPELRAKIEEAAQGEQVPDRWVPASGDWGRP